MRKKQQRSRAGMLIVIFICVAIVFALIWVVTTGLARLADYGSGTSVSAREEEENRQNEIASSEPVDAGLPRNTYLPEGFRTENGLIRYEDDTIIGVPGIDVSVHQQHIDWQQVKDAGVEFAIIQLGFRGYKSGALALDEYFLENMEGAANAGLDLGVYFFSQALNVEEAIEEAEFVINWLRGYEITYPVIFDWEMVSADARTDQMDLVQLTNCALAFCETMEEAGYTAGVYFNQQFGYQMINLPSLEEHVFWLAEYADVPSFAYSFDLWQYTDQGSVAGIDGYVDLNVAFHKK